VPVTTTANSIPLNPVTPTSVSISQSVLVPTFTTRVATEITALRHRVTSSAARLAEFGMEQQYYGSDDKQQWYNIGQDDKQSAAAATTLWY